MRRITGFAIPFLLLAAGCRAPEPKPAAPSAMRDKVQAAPSSTTPESTRKFGYLKSLTRKENQWRLEWEPAELFQGEEAKRAARADGAIKGEEEMPEDYYIRESKTAPLKNTLAEDAAILLIGTPPTADQNLPIHEFAGLFLEKDEESKAITESPFWLTFSGEKVTRIEQHYVP